MEINPVVSQFSVEARMALPAMLSADTVELLAWCLKWKPQCDRIVDNVANQAAKGIVKCMEGESLENLCFFHRLAEPWLNTPTANTIFRNLLVAEYGG